MIRYHHASASSRDTRKVRVAHRAGDIHLLQDSVEDVGAIRLAGRLIDVAHFVQGKQFCQNGVYGREERATKDYGIRNTLGASNTFIISDTHGTPPAHGRVLPRGDGWKVGTRFATHI